MISDKIYTSSNCLFKTCSVKENCWLDDERTEDKSRAIKKCEIVSLTFFEVQSRLIQVHIHVKGEINSRAI